MGFIYSILLVACPLVGYGFYSAYRLGPKLPFAARKMGRRIGMSYNYFRVFLKLIAPEEETALKMMAAYRKSN